MRSKPFIHFHPSIEDGTHDPTLRDQGDSAMAKKAKKSTAKTTAPAETRGPGRPTGAPNRDYSAIVAERRACCPHCGWSDALVVGRYPDQTYGATPDGQPCTRIERRRCLCAGCGKPFTRMTYVR